MTYIKFSLLFLLFFFSIAASGQRKIVSPRPRLVVFIQVDELSTDQLIAFRDKFTDNGFNRLMNGGSFFRHAYYPAGSVYAGSHLSTFFTGAYAATHGIISDKWYDRLRSTEVDATLGLTQTSLQDSLLPLPTTSQLLTSTLADELKWMHNGAANVSAIGLHTDLLVWAGGHAPDDVICMNSITGQFEALRDTLEAPQPIWLKEFNAKQLPNVYCEREWGPIMDLKEYHQLKYFSDALPGNHTFLYNLKKAKGREPFLPVINSPYGNKLVRDFTVNHIINSEIGKDDIPDLLTVQFTSKSNFRKDASAFEAETEDMLLRLDREVADLINIIDEQVGLEKTLIVLTGISSPIRTEEDYSRGNIPSGVFNGTKAASLLNLYLMAIHGQGKWVKAYHDGQVYLNHELLEQSKISIQSILDESARFLMQVEGVAYAMPASELMAASSNLAALQSLKLNYHPKRSGDILIRLQPGWNEELEDGSLVYRHWTSSKLPLVFFGWKVARQNVFTPIPMTNVAPTISSFLEIPFPNGCEGTILDSVAP